jgi:aldose 1-epimerase
MDLYTLTNANGLEARVINYGAHLISLKVPDRNGRFADVLLGFDRPEEYEQSNPYFGAIVGRYANRIAHGRFTLNGVTYQLATNDRGNHLHGGIRGFDKVFWQGQPSEPAGRGSGVALTYLSPNGEEGYPGTLQAKVTYILNDENGLEIHYEATTGQPTVINLTNHAYFNLADGGRETILDHVLMIAGSRVTPTDKASIPTGQIVSAHGTPFDFTRPTPIGARIQQDNEQLAYGLGYDHNWVLDKIGNELSLAATVHDPASGRFMEVLTTQPGIQFYSGNQLDGSVRGKQGIAYEFRSGLCLETQHFPDSPNHPSFPSTVLNPGSTYTQTTVYRFSVR